MARLTLNLPGMYGDHHVIEVRRILLEMPGVEEVYASSCFQVAEVTFDPAQIEAAAITSRLDRAGYLGDLAAPFESGVAVVAPEERASGASAPYFRHTIVYQETGRVIGFAQNVSDTVRALWPCPGMEPYPSMDTLQTKETQDGEERA